MVDYPTDLDLNGDKDVHLDAGNDLALIGGLGQLQQSVAINVMDVTQQFIARPLTGSTVGKLEEKIRQAVANDPQAEDPTSVDVTTYDRTRQAVVATVTTDADETFEIEVGA
jgi:hypothetical protein